MSSSSKEIHGNALMSFNSKGYLYSIELYHRLIDLPVLDAEINSKNNE